MVVQLARKVQSKALLLILQLKLNTLQHLMQQKEAVWIKKFITDLEVVPSITNLVDVYSDNNGAIAQAKEPRSHQRSKHILRRYHLIREIIERGDVKICRVPTDDNVADPLAKPLP